LDVRNVLMLGFTLRFRAKGKKLVACVRKVVVANELLYVRRYMQMSLDFHSKHSKGNYTWMVVFGVFHQ
jgi:hypothetical protein